VDIDVPRPVIRHNETETLLIVEEFYLTLDHRPAWAGVALTKASAAAEPVAATETVSSATESVTATEAVAAAAKPVTASTKAIAATATEAITTAAAETAAASASSAAVTEVAARAWVRIRCTQIDTMDRHHLEAAGRVLKVADNRCTLGQLCMTGSLNRGCMTECVTTPVFKRYEAVTLRPVEPLDRTFYGRLRYLTRSATLEVRHVDAEYCHQPEIPRHMLLVRSA
jgi:hypothetical protein